VIALAFKPILNFIRRSIQVTSDDGTAPAPGGSMNEKRTSQADRSILRRQGGSIATTSATSKSASGECLLTDRAIGIDDLLRMEFQ
jgi:hypothetical protein